MDLGIRGKTALEAVKFPREGAGLLSSLADTDGLVELGEDVVLPEHLVILVEVLDHPF